MVPRDRETPTGDDNESDVSTSERDHRHHDTYG